MTPNLLNNIQTALRQAAAASVALALPLLLAACSGATTTQGGVEEEGAVPPIAFGASLEAAAARTAADDDAHTRAVVEPGADGGVPADMEDFLVWGGHSGSVDNLFEATTVTPAGTYTGERYWVTGQRHDFYALHPATLPEEAKATVSAATTTDGADGGATMTVTGFDTRATGAAAVDLMTAQALGITPQADQTPGKVQLSFRHELARVNFLIRTEADGVTLRHTSLTGIAYKGNFTNAITTTTTATPSWEIIATADPAFSSTGPQELNIESEGIYFMDGDLLLIPQSLAGDDDNDDNPPALNLQWTYAGDDAAAAQSAQIPLHTQDHPKWEAGSSYLYTIVIPGTDAEVGFTVTAGKWDDNHTIYEEL